MLICKKSFQGDPVYVAIKCDRVKAESSESVSEAEDSPGVYHCSCFKSWFWLDEATCHH